MVRFFVAPQELLLQNPILTGENAQHARVLPFLQPQHFGMLGIFSCQNRMFCLKLLFWYKKPYHKPVLPVFFYSLPDFFKICNTFLK